MKTSVNLEIVKILSDAAKKKATDIHIMAGSPPVIRVDGELIDLAGEKQITRDFMENFSEAILNDKQKEMLKKNREVSLVYLLEDKIRFRVNVFYQKNTLAASLKIIPIKVPSLNDLALPKSIRNLAFEEKGLIIISGVFNSGRTTTAAAIIEEINRNKGKNILTVERPVEYLFLNNRSIIEQREVGRDVNSFKEALDYCRYEDVNVIFVDENKEEGLAKEILELAASGRLVMYIMSAVNSIQTLDRFISEFKPNEREKAQESLSQTLKAVVCQRLAPKANGGLVLAHEILLNIPAISSLIRDNKLKQIISILQSSREEGMISLDQSLAELVNKGDVLDKVALNFAEDENNFKTMIR